MRRVRLYLRLGDRVYHQHRLEWGSGAVVEEMTSIVEGGTCLVRVLFEDGVQRTFHNDLDNQMCCYFMGLRRDGPVFDDLGVPERAHCNRHNRIVSTRPRSS